MWLTNEFSFFCCVLRTVGEASLLSSFASKQGDGAEQSLLVWRFASELQAGLVERLVRWLLEQRAFLFMPAAPELVVSRAGASGGGE